MTFSTLASPGVSLQGGGGSGGGGGTPGGSNTQIQYNNSGSFAGASGLTTNGTELTIASGTKTADAPVLNMSQTWNNGAVTFTGLKFNAAGTSDANSAAASLLMDLQVNTVSQSGIDKNGNAHFGSYRAFIGSYRGNGTSWTGNLSGTAFVAPQLGGFTFYNSNGGSASAFTVDTFLTRRAAANLRLGDADATGTTAPTPQFLSAQSWASSTTNNQTGANFTIDGSQGTGTGAGGSIIFRVAPAGGTSNGVQNALSTALTIASTNAITVGANGTISFPTSATTLPSAPGIGAWVATLGIFGSSGALAATVSGININLSSNYSLEWGSDTKLFRDAANTLALRNGANAQAFRVYNTYTSDSVYERAEAFWSGNMFTLRTAQAGGGSARSMTISTQGDANLLFSTNSVTRADFSSLGIKFYQHILLPTDNTYDIGAASADRPRSVYAGTSITPGAGVVVASLPTPSTGMIARVTDATAPVIGATVAGGGAAYALVNYNGANWTVIGV